MYDWKLSRQKGWMQELMHAADTYKAATRILRHLVIRTPRSVYRLLRFIPTRNDSEFACARILILWQLIDLCIVWCSCQYKYQNRQDIMPRTCSQRRALGWSISRDYSGMHFDSRLFILVEHPHPSCLHPITQHGRPSTEQRIWSWLVAIQDSPFHWFESLAVWRIEPRGSCTVDDMLSWSTTCNGNIARLRSTLWNFADSRNHLGIHRTQVDSIRSKPLISIPVPQKSMDF